MSVDLDQFHAAFFEECGEALDSMESALLQLDAGTPDHETINTIFRAAHSIKGGAGMFAFTDIASFTHTLETLLDELRGGRMAVSAAISDALLQSVDVLRSMMAAVQRGVSTDAQRIAALHAVLTELIAKGEPPPAPDAVVASDAVAPAAVETPPQARGGWHLRFEPLPTLLASGNDPLRMFGELAAFGPLRVQPDLARLAGLHALEVERCDLAWDLFLTSDAPLPAIELIFEWAQGDCVLKIERMDAFAVEAPQPALVEAGPAGTTRLAASPLPEVVTEATPEAGAITAAAPVRTAGSEAHRAAAGDGGSIRVNIEKIDELLNTVGEIVITQSMLSQLAARLEGGEADRLRSGLAQLETNIRELQESVMRVRMLPVGSVFSRFPRLVRDLSNRLGKQVRLTTSGDQTELDKTVLEKIGDPLVHLVRNSIDHGIEQPAARMAAGKSAEGTVHLNAFHKGGSITLEVSDDGKGLDRERLLAKARSRGLIEVSATLTDAEVHDLIFLPGFSTAEKTTDVSGRGVGMDVVRRNILELGGTIELHSAPGQGTRFTINLPLTLAIVDGQSVAVGDEVYIVPLVTIIESLQLRAGASSSLVGHSEVIQFRGEYLPVIRLHEVFGVAAHRERLHEGLIMVVEGEGRRAGLFVDALLGQQQVVIKSLETNYGAVDGVGGATILGEGAVALILDVPGLIRLAAERGAARRAA